MKFDTGTIVTIIAVVLFYIRLIILQRQKSQALATSGASTSGKKSRAKKKGNKQSDFFKFHISSWPLVIAGVITISAGALLNAISPFGPQINQLWWIPVSIGIVLLAFSYN
jgi:sterol desaturase/sphingolipid hydroxylase (fatty acid hydroxylase superfamily)